MTAPLPLIIDCDPGIDDAVMLMMNQRRFQTIERSICELTSL